MKHTDEDHQTTQRRWRKILYEDQAVPDNYVDESFLDELKKNLHTRHYDYWSVVRESGSITQQLSSICCYIVAFLYMDYGLLSPRTLVMAAAGLTLIGYIIYCVSYKGDPSEKGRRTKWKDMKSVLTFTAFGFGLSPVLMSLTETISTDTIYAMCVFMLLANMLFHDYGAEAAMVSQTLSLNAAIFTSVCLASRLSTTEHAFATVTFALEVFALWPQLRRHLKMTYPSSQTIMTILSGSVAFLLLISLSSVAAVLFVLAHLFVSLVCPAWLTSMQVYKDNIHGPWDEAVIKD